MSFPANDLQENWPLDPIYRRRIIHPKNQGLLVFGICGEFLQSHDCEILDESLLDLIQAIMIFVKLLPGFGQELAVLEGLERRQMR